MQDTEFGMLTLAYGARWQWWDMPANRHSQGANSSFADGHAEHWRWAVPKVFRGLMQALAPVRTARLRPRRLRDSADLLT